MSHAQNFLEDYCERIMITPLRIQFKALIINYNLILVALLQKLRKKLF